MISWGQEGGYTYEAGLVTDNDAYYFASNDQYYTNGLMLYFRYVPKRFDDRLANKTVGFTIGQQIYNPYQGYVVAIDRVDRPFAGYLFLEAEISRFYEREAVLRTAWQVGVLGPSARGEEVQSFIHRTFNLYEIDGWQYQLHDAPGLNFRLDYLRSMRYFFKEHLDVSWLAEMRLGTVHTDIGAGFLARAGIFRLRPLYNTMATGSSINRKPANPDSRELFFYVKPRLSLVLYDATIQGGVYSDNNPVTFDARPLKLFIESGIRFSYKNLLTGYSLVFHTKEVMNDESTCHLYASIHLSIRF